MFARLRSFHERRCHAMQPTLGTPCARAPRAGTGHRACMRADLKRGEGQARALRALAGHGVQRVPCQPNVCGDKTHRLSICTELRHPVHAAAVTCTRCVRVTLRQKCDGRAARAAAAAARSDRASEARRLAATVGTAHEFGPSHAQQQPANTPWCSRTTKKNNCCALCCRSAAQSA